MADADEGTQRVSASVKDALLSDELKAQLEATVAQLTGQPQAEPAVPAPDAPAAPAEGTTQDGNPTDGDAGTPDPNATAGEPGAEGNEVPTSYFGEDLSDFEPDVRAKMIARFKEQDRFIQKLQREKAELEKNQGQPPAPEPEPVIVTDEMILSELGLEADDPSAPIVLPLAKQLLDLQTAVQSMYQQQTARDIVNDWNTKLDALEAQYGKLDSEITRDDVFEYAAENGLTEPAAAYWQIAGPAKALAAQSLAKERQDALRTLKLQQAGVLRPETATEGRTTKLEATSVRDAVKEAAKLAEQELGISWKEALDYEA